MLHDEGIVVEGFEQRGNSGGVGEEGQGAGGVGAHPRLHVMREAHALGMKTTATMVFGFQETSEQLLLHMDRLRSLQDDTRGFTAFITWPFQAEGTRLKLRDDTSPLRYLRIQALARLYLDNIPNLQVSWPTLGPEIGEVALRFGANDCVAIRIE